MNSKRLTGLRSTVLAALIGLLIAFVLGTTLDGQIPKSAQGRGLLGAFGDAVIGGPILLSLHAIIGTLIVISAATAVVHAVLTRSTRLIALTSGALLCVLLAWLGGSSLADTLAPGADRAMEWSAATALLLYAVVLFLNTPSPGPNDDVLPPSQHDTPRQEQR